MVQSKDEYAPDYDYWWNKPDLTKEELIWVMAGISPDDMSRYQELQNNNDKSPWYLGFYNYFRNKHRWWHYGKNKHQECDWHNISWDNKKQFVQDVYNTCITIDDGFLGYLENKGEFKKNPNLERYRDESQYWLDLENTEFDWKSIVREEEAVAVFLGLNPQTYKRFCDLDRQEENSGKEHLDFLKSLEPDDKWFFGFYGEFWHKYFFVFHARINSLKNLNLWHGNVSSYVKALHNHGVVFSPSFMRAFKKHILPDWEWQYEAGSRVWKEYQHWVNKEKVWTFEQAIFLFTGKIPPHQKGNYGEEITVYLTDYNLKIEYSSYEKRYVITAFEPDEYRDSGLKPFDIKERLENHILSGDIIGCDKENTKFRAKDIYKWLRENTVHQPPLALHSAVGESLKTYLNQSGEKSNPLNIKAESECKRYLINLAKDQNYPKPKKKSLKEECLKKFPELSERGFNRCWDEAAQENPSWSEAGRPKQS